MILTAYLNFRNGQLTNSQGGYGLFGDAEACAGTPPPGALRLQRGDKPTLRLRVFDPFTTNEAVLLPSGTTIIAALKKWDDHNNIAPLAQITDDAWDKPATLTDNVADDLTDDPGGFYLGTLDLSGDDLSALLPAGTSSVYCHLQIQTLADGIAQSSQWVPVLILSDVVRPTDGATIITSQPSASPRLYYKDITAYIGGGTTALNGISTVGKSKLLVDFIINNKVETAYLKSGEATQNLDDGIVLPLDYNASTNAQYWLIIG